MLKVDAGKQRWMPILHWAGDLVPLDSKCVFCAETGFEPPTSSLGIHPLIESKSLARFCCDFLNLQRLAESAFCHFVTAIES
jgi:hypothetical protein